jgi:hypothetical protein
MLVFVSTTNTAPAALTIEAATELLGAMKHGQVITVGGVSVEFEYGMWMLPTRDTTVLARAAKELVATAR